MDDLRGNLVLLRKEDQRGREDQSYRKDADTGSLMVSYCYTQHLLIFLNGHITVCSMNESEFVYQSPMGGYLDLL